MITLDIPHSFESYIENKDFQIQQMIQNILIENTIKEMNEQGLINVKD